MDKGGEKAPSFFVKKSKIMLAILCPTRYNILVRKEVVKMEEFIPDLIVALIVAIFSKALDETIEVIKKKTSKSKNSKKS